MAEQRGDREPVGKPAHHRRLGKGTKEAPDGMRPLAHAGKEEQARHRHQQPASDHSHAAHAALRRVEAVQPGTFDKAHSAGAGPAPSRWVSRLVKMRFRCGPSHLSRSSARVNPAGTITSVSRSEEHTSELQYLMRI